MATRWNTRSAAGMGMKQPVAWHNAEQAREPCRHLHRCRPPCGGARPSFLWGCPVGDGRGTVAGSLARVAHSGLGRLSVQVASSSAQLFAAGACRPRRTGRRNHQQANNKAGRGRHRRRQRRDHGNLLRGRGARSVRVESWLQTARYAPVCGLDCPAHGRSLTPWTALEVRRVAGLQATCTNRPPPACPTRRMLPTP